MEEYRRTGRTTRQLEYVLKNKDFEDFEVIYYVAKNNQMAKNFLGMAIDILTRCKTCKQAVACRPYAIDHSRMVLRVDGRYIHFISECNLRNALKGTHTKYLTIMDHVIYE